ncbi:MAG: replicative DNA helicase [Nocardioides sp.]
MAAEQSVLGSMLLSKDAIADVTETVRGTDFYRPAHELVHDAIIDLYGRGEPADPVTVAAELQRRGELVRVGGAPYLHTLAANVPIAANAGYYAEIVREKAILRRLVAAGTKIVQIGYAGEGQVDDVVDQAQAEVYQVTEKRASEDYAPLSDIMEGVLDEIEAIGNRDAGLYGVPTGFADLDDLTNGLHGGQMIIVAGRPAMGKSTLGLDFCRAASIHHNMASVIFSLEMNRSEITMRLLSAEARVPLNHIRNGNMGDDDWQRLARKMGEVSSAPMFIDDSPNMTMMEIRSKARRLKQRHDLRLVVIDYMQLMSSGKKVESRQLEVSEFSRQIKLLAKELEVPIVALSQLNRGPEQRGDKRPMMSDLRESGCLTADTTVMRADTNVEVTIGELMQSGATDVPVWALDERLKLVPRTMTHAFPSGTKPTFELTLSSGRRIQATANHKFLTFDGWMPLSELAAGTRVASVRHVPPPLQVTRREDAEIMSLVEPPARVESVEHSYRPNLPDWVHSLPKDQIAALLRCLWAKDGAVRFDPDTTECYVSYRAASRRNAERIARLLLRFNVFTHLRRARRSGAAEMWHLYVAGPENQLRFVDEVGVPEASRPAGRRLADHLRAIRDESARPAADDRVWGHLREVLANPNATSGAVLTRAPMARVAAVLDQHQLEVVATNDAVWDTIVSITPAGHELVYDATVLGLHNFVANGIATHNSLEQDADMVVLLHRDDVYEKESTRPGEADLIVAKHRNGPTRDITVAFQGHYSRFVDMAHG